MDFSYFQLKYKHQNFDFDITFYLMKNCYRYLKLILSPIT